MIHDVSELVAEAARIAGRNNLPAHAPMLIGFLERTLNTELRTDAMVTEAALTTDADGEQYLPSGYLEMISVTYGTNKKPLRRLTRSMLNTGVDGYCVSADRLISAKAGVAHTLTYYTEIPGLWASETNWLLQSHPEVYLRGLVYEMHKDANDAESAIAAKTLFDMAIVGVKADDRRERRIDTVVMPRTQI